MRHPVTKDPPIKGCARCKRRIFSGAIINIPSQRCLVCDQSFCLDCIQVHAAAEALMNPFDVPIHMEFS